MPSTCVLSWRIEGRTGRHRIVHDSAVLGRDQNCEIRIDRDTISRRHALFRREDGDGWFVTDLGSRNGVYVNGSRIEKQGLEDGDQITVGTVEMVCGLTRGSPSNAHIELEEDYPEESIARSIPIDQIAAHLNSDTGRYATPFPGGPASSGQTSAGSSVGLPMGMPLLELFQTASETLLSGLGLDAMLDRVLELVFRSLPKIERGFVCLLDENGQLVPRASRSERTSRGVETLKISRSVANAAIGERVAVLVQDARLDERFNTAESIVALRIRSVMCSPLSRGQDEEVVGIVYVDTAIPGQAFTEEDLALLSALSMLSAVAVEQARLRDEMEKERRLREELSRTLPPQIVEQLVHGEVGIEEAMRPREADISVLFADLVGFTRLSEQLSAIEITQLLNLIFERLAEIVFANRGAVDKYNGDEIIAFFGAPQAQVDHAERAVRTALAMQREIVNLAEEIRRPGQPLQFRIGVNSGLATVGGVGHPARRDFTVIGDVVNTAKRLESMVCKPGQVVIGPATREALPASFRCEALEEVTLKGKELRVCPWRVFDSE